MLVRIIVHGCNKTWKVQVSVNPTALGRPLGAADLGAIPCQPSSPENPRGQAKGLGRLRLQGSQRLWQPGGQAQSSRKRQETLLLEHNWTASASFGGPPRSC